jgi:hypothetical protein
LEQNSTVYQKYEQKWSNFGKINPAGAKYQAKSQKLEQKVGFIFPKLLHFCSYFW